MSTIFTKIKCLAHPVKQVHEKRPQISRPKIFKPKMNETHINNKSEGTYFKNFSLKSNTLN